MGGAVRPAGGAPDAAAPWRLYRTPAGGEAAGVEQLRFEIGHPGDKGDPKRYRLVIGGVDREGSFQPCLTVRSDCTVIVHGELVAEQLVIQGPAKADPSDPRLTTELTRQWLENLVATGVNLDAELKAKLEVTVELPATVQEGQTMTYTVTVGNAGPVELRGVTITEIVTIAGVAHSSQTKRHDQPLPPNGKLQTTSDVLVPPGTATKTLEVVAAVVASAPFGFPVGVETRQPKVISS